MDDGLFWAPDFRPALAAATAGGGRGDMSDPATLAAMRRLGPPPPQVEGVTWSDTTIPNTAGDHEIPVRVFRPDRPSPLRTGFVLFHGGGLSFGSLDTEHPRAVDLVRRTGAVGVSVGFRLAPEHPPAVILDDAWSGLVWLAGDGGEQLGVDPRRIALTGSSGGGMLTFSIAQLARDRGSVTPVLQLALYPNTDDRKLPLHVSRTGDYPVISQDNVDQVMHNLVPEPPAPPYILPNQTADLAGLCPAFVVIGQNDPLRDEGIDYTWRMIRAGVPTELHVLPGVAHAFELIAPTSHAAQLTYELSADAFVRAAELV